MPGLLSAPVSSPVAPQLIPRDYLAAPKPTSLKSAAGYTVKQYATAGQSYSVTTEPIVTATFPVSAASLSSAGSNVNLLWLKDNSSRNSANRTMLMHQSYDGATWSTPVAVADNGTADFSPVSLTFADGTIVAAWEDAKTALADSATLDEMFAQLEITAAIYDPVAKIWGNAVRLTDNATLDRTPKLAGTSKNNLMLTWIGNSQNDLSGSASKPNNLYYSLYNGASWSPSQVAAVIPNSIKRYTVVYDGTTANVVLALDTDDDLSTIEDLELYRLTYSGAAWGGLTRLTIDTIIDDNPQLALDPTNDVVLTWVKGNELSSVVNFNFANRTVIRSERSYSSTLADYKLATATDGKVAIIYAGTSEGSTSDLYALIFDPIFNLWGAPKQLTSDPETEMRPSIAFLGNETIVSVFNRKLLINPDGTPTTGALTSLYMLKHSMGIDLALVAGSLTADPPNAAPGSSVTFSVTAQNLGDKVSQNIAVNFYNGDPASGGTLIGFATIGDHFTPGDTTNVSAAWTIPAGATPITVYAVIDPNSLIDTLNRANNITSSKLASPDYYLQGIRWEKSGTKKYLLTVPVVNIGGTASPASTLTLRLESLTGQVLTTIPVAALARFESVDYTYTLDVTSLPVAAYTVVAIMDEAGLVQESNKYNNSAGVVIPPDTATLNVSLTGSGGGNVTSDPSGTNPLGITCTSGTCSTTFPAQSSSSRKKLREFLPSEICIGEVEGTSNDAKMLKLCNYPQFA